MFSLNIPCVSCQVTLLTLLTFASHSVVLPDSRVRHEVFRIFSSLFFDFSLSLFLAPSFGFCCHISFVNIYFPEITPRTSEAEGERIANNINTYIGDYCQPRAHTVRR